MGITWEQFWEMNPTIVNAHRDGYIKLIKEKNSLFYLQGMYMREALMSTVGNMFKGKATKGYEYPSQPFELNGGKGKESAVMTDAEKEEKTKALFQRLELMSANFKLAHANEGE